MCSLLQWGDDHRPDSAKKTAQCFSLFSWLIGSSVFLIIIRFDTYKWFGVFPERHHLILKLSFDVVQVGSIYVIGLIPQVKEGGCVH